MAIKKSQLYSKLWQSCDELRGGMDASQYKDYILTLLFIKYVSDKYDGDEDALFEIPEGSSFQDMVKLKGKTDIGDQINKSILKPLAQENDLLGVIDLADFNDDDKLGTGKEKQDKLTKLIAIFEGIDFGKNRAQGDDLLGDAYEYLMRNFATQSGKSKGQFYTPAEVSRIMSKVIGIENSTSQQQSVYDPTCGSGSLLLKAADEAPHGISIYGQEMDNATCALAKMNMVIHNHLTAKDEILQGNTLSTPLHKNDKKTGLKTFDFAVSNPPFSMKAWTAGVSPTNDEYKRFEYGIPPEKNGDFAFLLHLITSLKSKGKGAIVLPHGVLFRGNAEATIRENLIRQGLIKGIIGLPANLFYGTGIPACIILIDKEGAAARRGIFIVDASKGFAKDGNKNRLREQDIRKVVDVCRGLIELPKYSRMVPFEEIENNEYNLNIPRYIDSQEAEDIQDIAAHLLGDIPTRDVDALDIYWQVCPNLRTTLFDKSDRPDYRKIKVAAADIKDAIFSHSEFKAYTAGIYKAFETWKQTYTPQLKDMTTGVKPKELIQELGDQLLQTFANKRLIDYYDIYQYLMTYWLDTMQDDVYSISAEGWQAEVKRIIIVTKSKNKNKPDKETDKGWECDLIPKPLVINRYFEKEQTIINQLNSILENIGSQIEELKEEHNGEENALHQIGSKKEAEIALADNLKLAWQTYLPDSFAQYENAIKNIVTAQQNAEEFEQSPSLNHLQNKKGKITKTVLTNRRKKIANPDGDPSDEEKLITGLLITLEELANARKKAKKLKTEAYEELEKQIATKTDLDYYKEIRILREFLSLLAEQAETKKEIKNAEEALDDQLLQKYPELTPDEIKQLVVDDKWMASLQADVQNEMNRIAQQLTQRIKELADRYENPLPKLTATVTNEENKVIAHLQKMGFQWN